MDKHLLRVTMILVVWLATASLASAQTTVEYIHTDALGTPVVVTNSAGAVIERSVYEPYGQLINRPLTDGPGFTGHVQDAATGLTYMQQRYYDPGIGRFVSVDPVTADGNTGDNFNRYWYANNNPYKFTDPDGRLANFIIGAGIGAGIEIVSQIATKGKVDSWTAVGVSAGVGALTGGVASIAGKAAVSGAISARTAVAATAATGGLASGTGKVVEGAIAGKPASAKEVAVAGVAGLAGSGAGAKIGLNAVAKLETMAASNGIAGHVGRTTQAAVQQGGKITEASTSATQKAAQVTADTASSYVEKKVNK